MSVIPAYVWIFLWSWHVVLCSAAEAQKEQQQKISYLSQLHWELDFLRSFKFCGSLYPRCYRVAILSLWDQHTSLICPSEPLSVAMCEEEVCLAPEAGLGVTCLAACQGAPGQDSDFCTAAAGASTIAIRR